MTARFELEAALQNNNLEHVVVLVERGAPMCGVATARPRGRIARIIDESYIQRQRATLIAAAHWAGRGAELDQDFMKAVTADPGIHLQDLTGLVKAVPPTKECEKACVRAVGAEFLALLVQRGRSADRARIEQMVHSGAGMHLVGRTALMPNPTGFKMLYRVACKAGRDSELLKVIEQDKGGIVNRFVQRVPRRKKGEVLGDLQQLRDCSLLGPFSGALLVAIRARQYLVEHGWNLETPQINLEMQCLKSVEELLMEYAEADRWYAQYLASMLSQRTSDHPAQLIAMFVVAEPAQKHERRFKYEDGPAYTWPEFCNYYGSIADARWHWVHASPACHEEQLQSTVLGEAITPSTGGSASQADVSSSVIELVLHADPPARVEPEIAGELAAAMEASAMERQLDSVVLEEAELQATVQQVLIDRLVVLQFNRCSKTLRGALAEGLSLKHCREELEKEGCDFLLPCRNMIFVHPSQYQDAKRAALPMWSSYIHLDTMKLGCFYVIVAESLEYLVELSLVGIGNGAWARTRDTLPLPSPTDAASVDVHELREESDSDEDSAPYVIKRTFLELAKHPMQNSASVPQSTTQVHAMQSIWLIAEHGLELRGGRNPRRFLPTDM